MLDRRSVLVLGPAAAVLGASAFSKIAVLDEAAIPGLDDPGRRAYHVFLMMDLPRAFAVGKGGRFGLAGGALSLQAARQQALAQAGPDARLVAEDLTVVSSGATSSLPPQRPPLIETWNYSFVPDARFLWRGPDNARGAYIWAHGTSSDPLGLQPPPHVRVFNNAGFDIIRFDRVPNADDVDRAASWLRDGIRTIRRAGWARVIAGGHSRGAWNCLQMLKVADLADVVVAESPAAHGVASGFFMSAQTDDFRQIVTAVPATKTRLAFIQFGRDEYIADATARARMIESLRPRLAGLLSIDRPPAYYGHFAARDLRFAVEFGARLLALAA